MVCLCCVFFSLVDLWHAGSFKIIYMYVYGMLFMRIEVIIHEQEKLALTCELQEVSQQLSQQSEFCATMGAACCTLLWRVSRCEDSIPSILVGVSNLSHRYCGCNLNAYFVMTANSV